MADGDKGIAERPLWDTVDSSETSEMLDSIRDAGWSISSVVPLRPKMFCRTAEASEFDLGTAVGRLTLALNC
jgi:hypothetical protein